MRIGFDAKRLFNNFTGLGNYSRFVVDALSEYYPDNEYTLYTPKFRQHNEIFRYLDNPQYAVRMPDSAIAKAMKGYWRTVSVSKRWANDGIEIYHGLSNELPLSKADGVKTVMTVHDLIFKRFPGYYKALDVAIYNWKVSKACLSADKIIAVSQQTANDLREFYQVDERKLVVVYQGCHPQFHLSVTPERLSEVKDKYKLPDEFVLCVGTLEKRKNAALAVRALSRMKEKVTIVFVGRPTSYMNELVGLTASLGLSKYVRFIHQASFSELPAIYKLAKLFIYPSVFEGFGIPIVEAIACGVPVISSNGSCFSEAGGPHCIYVNPSSADELAHEMTNVLGSAELRNSMVLGSKSYIEKFKPKVIADDLMRVYHQTLKP